ncbi:hypothetical protein DFH08DRAFT_962038 [Mycena albidolilacea]|uniref:HAT C-terminal dimerisation domain-containing protein n=1 Tax=Mycena albidolilacea TaxID=1033008 RepID=A0AAD6ZY24_9AGAR|nr:hypothetical protein DFH08DRAFT_962038 [Mycena albidolilacea]
MVHTLEVFKRTTLLSSSDEKSTIAHVITTMDKIDDILTSTIVPSLGRRPIHNSVCKALNLAKTTLNKYYSHTDTSNVYHIAMVLPSLKLEYFRLQKWDQDWINTAKQLVQDEFDLSYDSHDNNDNDGNMEIVDRADAVSVSSSAVKLDLAADWLFDIDISSTCTGKTELEQYLAEPIVAGVKDTLNWWYGKRDHSVVERVFSQGHHVLSFSRNRLTGISIRRFLCLGSWSWKDLVRDDDAVKAVKQVMKGKARADGDAIKCKQPEGGNEEGGGAGKKSCTS